MGAARRGIATDEMKLVAKDEDVTLDWLIPKFQKGPLLIQGINFEHKKFQTVAFERELKLKVNATFEQLH